MSLHMSAAKSFNAKKNRQVIPLIIFNSRSCGLPSSLPHPSPKNPGLLSYQIKQYYFGNLNRYQHKKLITLLLRLLQINHTIKKNDTISTGGFLSDSYRWWNKGNATSLMLTSFSGSTNIHFHSIILCFLSNECNEFLNNYRKLQFFKNCCTASNSDSQLFGFDIICISKKPCGLISSKLDTQRLILCKEI